ncbi:MAG: alkaline phosphatase family protein, partial [Muribaculaceae bacterium]|nr:alkaline phosphatase family protein [Muribaculaceae bacterium]
MQKSKHTYNSSKIALAIAALVCAQPVIQSQTPPPKRPQLVVGIVVDGLKAEYLDLLNGYFSDGGFKRLIKDGVTIENVNYGTPVDHTAATAMLYTGAAPAVNGIPASEIYDQERKVAYSIFMDPSKIGNFTDETYSPTAMLVSTLSDEIRMDNSGLGAVHAIAPDAQTAMIMGGHAGNSAFWLSEVNGKWATTTFYKDVPTTISTRNFTAPLSARLDTMVWTPSLPIESYPDLPDFKKYYPFRYHFSAGNRDRFNWFKKSGPGNTEITNVAIDYIT